MNLKFKDIKKYISIIDRLSICNKETLQYQNYKCMVEVPDIFDEMYVYGIGHIQSEFEEDGNLIFTHCIEIMLSTEPRFEDK